MDRSELLALTQYYQDQAGGNLNPYHSVGAIDLRGHGIGSFLGGLYRMVLPLIRSPTSKHVGKLFVNSAADVLDDFSADPSISSLRSSLKRRSMSAASSAAKEIAKNMRGGGLTLARTGVKARRKRSKRRPASRARSTVKKKKSTIKARAKPRKRAVSRKSSTRKTSFGYLN